MPQNHHLPHTPESILHSQDADVIGPSPTSITSKQAPNTSLNHTLKSTAPRLRTPSPTDDQHPLGSPSNEAPPPPR